MHLLADIGGTNARFQLWDPHGLAGCVVQRRCADFQDITALISDVLGEMAETPRALLLAVAGPVQGDMVALTNLDWRFSCQHIAKAFGFDDCRVINDFAALAWSLPAMGPADLRPIGGGAPDPRAAAVVLGPGTGLGVSALVPAGQDWAVVEGEGGHASLAAENDFDGALLRHLRGQLGHVSREAVLSGPGMVRLYRAVMSVTGSAPGTAAADGALQPEDISAFATQDRGGAAGQAIAAFCRLLGGYAGDLALIFGARGGVYIAGGIVPSLGPLFDHGEFRGNFEAKGQMADYVAKIPSYVITAPTPALVGLARLAASRL